MVNRARSVRGLLGFSGRMTAASASNDASACSSRFARSCRRVSAAQARPAGDEHRRRRRTFLLRQRDFRLTCFMRLAYFPLGIAEAAWIAAAPPFTGLFRKHRGRVLLYVGDAIDRATISWRWGYRVSVVWIWFVRCHKFIGPNNAMENNARGSGVFGARSNARARLRVRRACLILCVRQKAKGGRGEAPTKADVPPPQWHHPRLLSPPFPSRGCAASFALGLMPAFAPCPARPPRLVRCARQGREPTV